jgi:hypothetical protein
MATIVVDSTPQGAEVFGPDKTSLGKTPVRITLPISTTPLDFELKLAGYRRKTKQVVVSGNAVLQVTLDRAPSTGTGKGKGKGSGDSELMNPDDL